MITYEKASIKVADECWLALAKLTRNHPRRPSFTVREIVEQARREGAHPELRPGVQIHAHLHNVANLPPNSARYRMFYRMNDGSVRLYRPGDRHHPERTGKICPYRRDFPARYHQYLDWYEQEYCGGASAALPDDEDPIMMLRGTGKEVWAGVDPDAYVEELRSGWEGDPAPVSKVPRNGAVNVWAKILEHQGEEFRTITDLPFTYEVEGASGVWIYREGRRINRRLSRKEIEAAVQRCPLTSPVELKEFQDPSYLFGLLTDRRIIG